MSAKTTALSIAVVTSACTAMAFISSAFPGWKPLTESSPDIIIARCVSTPEQNDRKLNGVSIDPDGLIEANIQVLSILKNATNWGKELLKTPALGAARLRSAYRPCQNEYFLAFAMLHDGEYYAAENYRIVPLGLSFSTNSINAKSLDEQVRILLLRRLDALTSNMKQEQEEKERLEDEFKK